MSLDPVKTSVILLGSASFQSVTFDDSIAFSEANKRIKSYFKNTLDLPDANILDLFESEFGADEQDMSISRFITTKKEGGCRDLFIYYVGHGGFTPTDSTFYLALKNTREQNPALSSLTIKSLGHTISTNANALRTFFILDCCFAAAAGTGFMSSENQIPAVQIKDAFPPKGITMLCASSKDSPAMIVKDRNITMFTEGFQLALLNGASHINEKLLSLRQILELTNSFIKEKNPNNAVLAEIQSPGQSYGDIADIQIFKNFGYIDSPYDIKTKKDNIIVAMANNDFVNLGNLLLDFVREYDEYEDLLMNAILLSSECNELFQGKENLSFDNYNLRKKELYPQVLSIVNQIVENLKSKAA